MSRLRRISLYYLRTTRVILGRLITGVSNYLLRYRIFFVIINKYVIPAKVSTARASHYTIQLYRSLVKPGMTRVGRTLKRFGFYIPTKKLLATTTLLAFLFNLCLPLIGSYLDTIRWNVTASYTSISDSSSKDYLFQAENEDLSAFFGDKEYSNSHRFAVLKNSAKFDLRLTEGEGKCPLNSQGCTQVGTGNSLLTSPVIDFASLEGKEETANLSRNLREQLEDLSQQSAQPQDGTTDGVIRTARLIKSVGSSDDRVEFVRSENNRDIQINYEVITRGIKQSIFLNRHSLPTYQFLLNLQGLKVIKTGESSYLLIDTEQSVAIQIGKPQVLGTRPDQPSPASINIHQEPRGIIMELGVTPDSIASLQNDTPLIVEVNYLISTDQTLLSRINEVTQGILDNPTKTLSVRGSNHPDYLYEHINNKFQVGFGSKLKGKTQVVFSSGGLGGIEMALLGEGKNVTVRQNTRLESDETLNKEASVMEGGSPYVLAAQSSADQAESQTLVDSIQAVDARENVDIEYKVFPQGVKENIIVRSPASTANTFKYALKTSGVTPVKNKEGLWEFQSGDKPLFSIPQPYAIDNSGTITTDVTLDIAKGSECLKSFKQFSAEGNGCYTVTIEIKPEWMNDSNRSYPIVIDPSIVDDTTAEFAITNDSTSSTALNRIKDTGSGASPVLETFYQETVADVSTIGLWHMNESTANQCSGGSNDLCDASGNALNLAFNGNAAFTTSSQRLGASAVALDGTGDYLTVSDNQALTLGADFTVSTWVYFTAAPAAGLGAAIYSQDDGAAVFSPLLFTVETDLDVKIWSSSNNSSWDILSATEWEATSALTTGAWHHLALTHSRWGWHVYVDGAQLPGNVSSSVGTPMNSTRAVYIGGQAQSTTGSGGINGFIDEFTVLKRAWSAEEVKINSARRPYATFTSTVFDFTANMAALQSLTWTENGVVTGDGETLSSSTSLIGKWDFNEGSGTAVDNAEGTAARDLAITNATTSGEDAAVGDGWTENNKRWGASAFMFDGTDAYASCTDANCGGTSALDIGSRAWTIAAWVKSSKTATAMHIASKGVSAGEYSYQLLVDTNSKVQFTLINTGGTNYSNATSRSTVPDGNWHYVVGTWDPSGTATKLYIDGILESSTTTTSGTLETDVTADFSVGRRSDGSYFKGVIDSVSVYARALTQNEITANYNHSNIEFQTRSGTTATPNDGTWEAWKPTTNETAVASMDGPFQYSTSESGSVAYWAMDETSGTTVDDEVSTNDGTATNGPTIVDGKFGKARGFDGTDDYIETVDINSLDGASTMTVEAWFFQPSLSTDKTIISKWDHATQDSWVIQTSSASSDELYIFIASSITDSGANYCTTTDADLIAGNWFHLAVVYDGTQSSDATELKVYLNGAQKTCSFTGSIPDTLSSASSTVKIGRIGGSLTRYFTGVIDEVRIFSSALSSATVKEHYNEGASQITGNTIANSTDTSLKIEGTASQRTILGAPKVDSKTEALWRMDETNSGGPVYDSSGYRAFATDSSGHLESTLVSYWKFDDSGATAVDAVSKNDGTVTGTTVTASGKLSNAKTFDGDADVVRKTDTNLIDVGLTTESYTVSVWFKTSAATTQAIISKNDSSGNIYPFEVYVNTSGNVVFAIFDNTNNPGVTSTATYNDGAWHHMVAVRNVSADQLQLYIDTTSKTATDTTTATMQNNDDLSIGNSGTGYALNDFNGTLDEVGLWRRALSSSEVSDLYNSSSANSLTSVASENGGVTGTTAPTVVDGYTGKGLDFDGTDDYIAVPTITLGSTPITVSGWFYPETSGGLNVFWNDSGTPVYGMRVGNSDVRCLVRDADGDMLDNNPGVLVTGWTHVACTFDPATNTVIVYVNGVYVQATTNALTNFATAATTWSILGALGGPASVYYNGKMDEIHVSRVVKTYDEIREEAYGGRNHRIGKAISSTDLSGKSTMPFYIAADRPGTYLEATVGESYYANYEPDANTVGLWHLEEVEGTSPHVKDYSGYYNIGTIPAATKSVYGKIGKARHFDGSSSVITFPDDADLDFGSTSDFSVEAWIRLTASAAYYTPVGKYEASGSTGYRLVNIITSGLIAFQAGAGGSSDIVTSAVAVNDGNWHHVVGVRSSSGTNLKIYVDGMLSGETTATARNVDNNGVFAIGRAGSYTDYFPGMIDEVRLSNKARDADEIRQAFEISKRTHPITIDFASSLQAAYTSGTSITINNSFGQTNMSDSLKPGDTLIVQENVGGNEYRSTATVSKIANTSSVYGTVTLAAAFTSTTLPPGGYTTNAKAFKWQREYFPLQAITLRGTHDNAITRLTIRATDGSVGANIWLDDFKSNSSYLTTSSGETPTSSAQRYFQYRAIFTNADPAVTANLTAVTQNYRVGPRMDQIMRHGAWFNAAGAEQPFWWSQ